MTSRQRVQAAFNHQTPDRTPIFEKLIKSPIADELLGRPCAATNFETQMEYLADGDWQGLQKQSARDLVELAVNLGFDLIRLYPTGGPSAEGVRPKRIAPHTWEFAETITEILDSGWMRSWPVTPAPPVSETEQENAMRNLLEQTPQPAQYHPDSFLMLREARRLLETQGHDLVIFSEAYPMGAATLPAFMFRWFIDEPELMHKYYDRQSIWAFGAIESLINEGADIIALGGDLACDMGPIISPAHYREFIMPGMRKQAELCHARGVVCSNATDGDIWSIADDFLLGTGVDGFEEIDFAAGMDLTRLKQEYGKHITFIGNIDIRHTLTSGTVEQVKAHTRECIQKGWDNGGHILMSSNCIHEGCKLELFLAHLETYKEWFGVT